jgi:hypothetical protein
MNSLLKQILVSGLPFGAPWETPNGKGFAILENLSQYFKDL